MPLKRPTQTRLGQRLPLRACVSLGLAPDGVYQEQSHQCSSWSLTPRFHPCLCRKRPSAVHFCGTILQLALTGRYPASCPMEPGLSSRESITSDCLTNFPATFVSILGSKEKLNTQLLHKLKGFGSDMRSMENRACPIFFCHGLKSSCNALLHNLLRIVTWINDAQAGY